MTPDRMLSRKIRSWLVLLALLRFAGPVRAADCGAGSFELRHAGSTTIQIALAWEPQSDASGYLVQRSTSGAFDQNLTSYSISAAVHSYGDTGRGPEAKYRFHAGPYCNNPSQCAALVLGQTYYYRVVAELGGGGTRISGCQSATLMSGPVRGIAGDQWADVVVGQPDFGDNMFRKTTAASSNWAGAVHVDKHHTPNRLYLADTNQNRILGFDHVGHCPDTQPCTTDSDCTAGTCVLDSPNLLPKVVIGQPGPIDFASCNGDGTGQVYPLRAPASASTLCLIAPIQISPGETVFAAPMDVTADGSLFVSDLWNNRVLRYDDPLAIGADAAADDVWGQADFSGNSCNRGASLQADGCRKLCFTNYVSGAEHAGITLDDSGNLWVADPGNHRVLRFPKCTSALGVCSGETLGHIAHTADIVLGQQSCQGSASGSGLTQLMNPLDVAFDARTQTLYVVDGPTPGTPRTLAYHAPFSTGMAAQQLSNGANPDAPFSCRNIYVDVEPIDANTSGLLLQGLCPAPEDLANPPTRLINLNTMATVDSVRTLRADGQATDGDGNLFVISKWYNLYRHKHNTATGLWEPAQVVFSGDPHVAPATSADSTHSIGGIAVWQDKLVVADFTRLLFWSGFNPADPESIPAAADIVFGEPDFGTTSFSNFFGYPQTRGNNLWVARRGAGVSILVFSDLGQPPREIKLTKYDDFDGYPLRGDPQGRRICARGADMLDFAAARDEKQVWVADRWSSRVYRVRDLDTENPYVDVVLGQAGPVCDPCNLDLCPGGVEDSGQSLCNRGGGFPRQDTLCAPYNVELDAQGNVYVADNGGEGGSNQRIVEYDASMFPQNPTSVTYGPPGSRVFGTGGRFISRSPDWGRCSAGSATPCTQNSECSAGVCAGAAPQISPFKPTFFAGGEMVIGNNPYDTQRFPLMYENPQGEQLPQMVLGDLTSYPGGSYFVDDFHNFYLADTNWARVLIYKDPLAALRFEPVGGPTATRTPMQPLTPTWTSTPAPGTCNATPRVGCRTSSTAKLTLKRGAKPAQQKLSWVMRDGAATTAMDLGNPVSGSTDYALCLYDDAGTGLALVLSARAPHGEVCSLHRCWSAGRSGQIAYVDHEASPNGLTKLRVRPGDPSFLEVRGRGLALPLPILPLAQSPRILAQLVNSAGTCWGGSFDAPAVRSDTREFRDRLP